MQRGKRNSRPKEPYSPLALPWRLWLAAHLVTMNLAISVPVGLSP
ncbi:hypothetical protein CBM2587_A200026 [Cupriavidus taiwanensis]|uniref:Uncharacterized protein n=1 Tax=Cupriavidus taiwanensis TaxID=164546 RepID=A0A375BR04_9BURK|nr:hypothetical protein CBM2587_A200026 [Cupriavidus taiwanensis]